MTSIVYEAEIDIHIDEVWINGEEGALRVYANEEQWDEGLDLAVFENAGAAYDFIDQFEAALTEAGFHRAEED